MPLLYELIYGLQPELANSGQNANAAAASTSNADLGNLGTFNDRE